MTPVPPFITSPLIESPLIGRILVVSAVLISVCVALGWGEIAYRWELWYRYGQVVGSNHVMDGYFERLWHYAVAGLILISVGLAVALCARRWWLAGWLGVLVVACVGIPLTADAMHVRGVLVNYSEAHNI